MGRYLFRAGDTARAQRELETLVEEMPAGHDRSQALLVLATILIFAAGKPAGIAMLEKALDEASADLALQARARPSRAQDRAAFLSPSASSKRTASTRPVPWTEQHYARALVDAHLGRIDAAKAHIKEGLSVAATAQDPWMAMLFYGVLGFAELSAGDYAEAEASLSRAVDLGDAAGLAEPAAWRFHANHIEAVIGLGDLPRAERLLGRLDEWGRATGRPWTLATAARCQALLLAARGDTDGAERALDEALRHHQQLAMPFELARTLLVMGQVQRRGKQKRTSKEYLDRALAIFGSLPAPLWADRTHSELSRLGLRAPAPLTLTATEERVAAMAASGRTNRQVAQALFVSTRTVEANLARVYRKLVISSRAELGAAMARQQASLQS